MSGERYQASNTRIMLKLAGWWLAAPFILAVAVGEAVVEGVRDLVLGGDPSVEPDR